jgi:hypothetical protein
VTGEYNALVFGRSRDRGDTLTRRSADGHS